jgi:outer membrane protein insertion porin family
MDGAAGERKNGLLMRYKFVIVGFLAFVLTAVLPAVIPAGMSVAQAQTVSSIVIEGNQRVENDTILSYLQISPGDAFSADKVDESVKSLFQTGLFSDVQIGRRGNQLVVRVEENPMINRSTG